jgi:hypothetical protein
MKRLALLLSLVGVVGLGVAFAASAGGNSAKVVKFERMAPVVAPFTGSTMPPNPIRGINGGGVPWSIESGTGFLRADGRLHIQVEGLIIPARGDNPVSAFRGVVNCLTPDAPMSGVNLVTDPFSATMTGDSTIDAMVDLPDTCIAPIVFVTNGTGSAPGAWFATTGTG